MNVKTTLVLFVTLAALGSIYVIVQKKPEAQPEPKPSNTYGTTTPQAAADLMEEPFGDVVKVSCRRKGNAEWVFEKNAVDSATGQDEWNMTSPIEMKCVSWEVGRFAQQLGQLQYDLSYKPGEPGGVTLALAGLEPPVATVALTDDAGETVTVEIGRSAGATETYVRLVGDERIFVANRDLSKLVKGDLLGYREKQLWNFDSKNVTRVEVVDRSDRASPITYAFAKGPGYWMMESPVTARATSKVDDLLTAMSRQRVTEWNENDESKLAMYGLAPATWTVSATVEEVVAPVSDPGEEAPAEPQKKTTVYVFHISDLSPIGKDTNTYVRIGDEHAVGTIMTTAADKFKPVMSQWREMRVTTANANIATRVDITVPEGSASLILKGTNWVFDPDGGPAESSALTEFLNAVAALQAVTIIDNGDPTAMGLVNPVAQVSLTIPGADYVEKIAIGDFTDQSTKRLRYVRRNDLSSMAKVKTSDLTKIMQGPNVYRDRTVIDVLPSRFEAISLIAPSAFTGQSQTIRLERESNSWNLTAPVAADVRMDQVDKLVEALGRLRAERVVGSEGQSSAFGLHNPSLGILLTYKPPKEYRIEGAGADGESPEPVEVQPPSTTIEIFLSEHDGKIYAKRSDRPAIYEIKKDLHTQVLAEYRSDRVVDFDETKITKFSIRKTDLTHAFEKTEDKWVYSAEPDLPLDSTKVDNLLLQIRDLRTQRFVIHEGADLVRYGMNAPAHEITVTLEDGSTRSLMVSTQKSSIGTSPGFYATLEGTGSVFLLTDDAVQRVEVDLDELE